MALESTRLLHRQSDVTQRLCLTVDSPALNENVLRSAAATVSPTFSIADILASSSYPESTGERTVPDARQAYKESVVVVPDHQPTTCAVSPTEQVPISPKHQPEDLSWKRTCEIDSIASPSDSADALIKFSTTSDTEQSAIGKQTESLSPETDWKPPEPETAVNDSTDPETQLPEVDNKLTHPTELSTDQSCRLTRSELVQLDLVAMRQEVATETDPVDKPTETAKENTYSSLSSAVDGCLHESFDDLIDAARCLRAETQLQEAESVVDALIAKFAEPLDLYTAWENLHRPDPMASAIRQDDPTAPFQSVPTYSSAATTSSSFSPIILPLLLSQPKSSIFPQLCQPSSTGRQLFELCKQLAGDIRRLKRKLRVLHKARVRRSASVSTRPATLGHKPTAATTSTIGERRSAFLRRLNSIWPEQSTVPEDDAMHDSSTCDHRPTNSRAPPVPCIYTNPMECPLSLLSFVCDSVDALQPHSRSRPRVDGFNHHYGHELTVQITTAESGHRSPAALSSCPSLSDTHTFPSIESPHLPAFSLLSPSLSPSSCSTISGGGVAVTSVPAGRLALPASPHPRKPRASGRREAQSKGSVVCKMLKTSDSTSCSSSSASSLSSPRRQKRTRGGGGGGGRQSSGKNQPAHKAKSRRGRDSIQVARPPSFSSVQFGTRVSSSENPGYTVPGSTHIRHDRSTGDVERAPELQLPCPIQNGLSRLRTKWEQLQVVVRDSDSAVPLPTGTESESLIAPDLSSPVDISRTAPCSAPCVSYFKSRSVKSDEDSQMTTAAGHFHQHDLDDSGAFSSSDEPSWVGHGDSQNSSINNRPPTPDIRRSDLDLADLSDGTRVLIIQDTHLRAGTLYLGSSSSVSSSALPTSSSLRDQLFRIQLDAERPPPTPTHHNHHPQGSPRFTSLPSPSRMNANGGSATVHPTRRTSSPAQTGSFLGHSLRGQTFTGSGTPKKRRQSDLILYGWQVVQQAVLEVFPASVRHVPPGTRVCAAWSEQLAADLYPGTVAEAEPKEQMQHNCVPVGFDDGDRRQVSIHNIRILPDNFTNLYELASSTHAAGGLVSDLLPTTTANTSLNILGTKNRQTTLDHRTVDLNSTRATSRLSSSTRVRHHSAMDHRPAMRMSTTLSPPSSLADSGRVKRVDRVQRRNHSPTTTNVTAVRRNDNKEEAKSPLYEQSKSLTEQTGCLYSPSERSSSKSPVTAQLTNSRPVQKLPLGSLAESEDVKSVTSPAELQPCELTTSDAIDLALDTDRENVNEYSSSEKFRIGSPSEIDRIAPGDSGNTNQHLNHGSGSPILENDILSDSLSTMSTGSDHPIWHILDKVRRRRHGRIFCRSIVRQTDGLVISIGDSVEFSSGHDEVYLGEVRAIRWDEAMDAPVVTAAWYYNLNEAGEEGRLIMELKGAVFATEHHDENEARCIVRRAVVAPSYAAYQAMMAGEPDPTPRESTPKPKINVDPNESQTTATTTTTTMTDSNAESESPADQTNHADHVNGLTAEPMDTGPDQQRKLSDSSSSSTGEEAAAVYFIAGKYDPVHRRVIAWDPDISRMIKSPRDSSPGVCEQHTK